MSFRERLGLRGRIFIILAGLVFITLAGGAVMIWYTYQMDALFASAIERDAAALEEAEELEIELVKQKGFVSYYFITGETDWLIELNAHRREFKKLMESVKENARSDAEKEILERIDREYSEYVESKDKVIEFYKSGQREAGSLLHEKVRDRFSIILDLTKEFREVHKKNLRSSLDESAARARRLRFTAATAMSAAAVLGALLAFVLFIQILGPIRSLVREADPNQPASGAGDEVSQLSSRVHGLIYDVDLAREELEKSREMLLQSEKMAVMGKLAADVAHSIRNPMTSIKMRLFSLERSLELTQTQQDDLEVVSEEMRRLDNIVRNFLEFSRPPKLKMRKVNISEILDMTFQLLAHRLERENVEVERPHRYTLPEIEADPELLKEVVVNLMVNALDAMKDGGKIRITGEEAVAEEIGRAVLIRISDTGPGIPESIQEKVFEPFFSTKDEGTGLGLAIAKRIIEEHRGRIMLQSEEGEGASFTIILPVWEEGR